jgi:hypothetical protein
MAVKCLRNVPKRTSVGDATLTVLVPGDDVRVIWIVPEAALWLVISPTLREGDVLPTDRIPIAANERYPAIVTPGSRLLVRSDTGTINVVCHGVYE